MDNPVSYTNDTDITEILLKVALNTTSVLIDTDYIGSCKSNCHAITATKTP
jgi:hypothetical protein